MIFVSEADVRRLMTWPAIIAAIEQGFISLALNKAQVFDVVRAAGGGEGHFFAIKSGRDATIPALGLKAGSYAPSNVDRGMAAHTSTTLLINDHTGRPFAVVDANFLNGMRTAAADAIAVRLLARPDAKVLAVIGAGDQAGFDVAAICSVRQIKRVVGWTRSASRWRQFVERVEAECSLTPELLSIEQAIRQADIVSTLTPSREPLVHDEWLGDGVHVSAMGADDIGKQELDAGVYRRARVFVDIARQAAFIGESQHAFGAGDIGMEALERGELGRVLLGLTPGRLSGDEITVFDSSGVAVQDIAAAYCVAELKAREMGVTLEIGS
jgi:ornithine cyclodeaminase